jgi:CheY-like chemotaxis protein
VLLDLELPKLRGPDCLQAMRAVAPAVRALLISGHAGAVSDEQWQAVGFRGVVGKPFRAVELLRALDSALAQG